MIVHGMLHALGTVYIAEVLKNVAHLFALAGLGVKWAKLIKERTGIGIFLDTSAGYLDVKLKTGKVPILVENCPEVLLDKGLWEECAAAKPNCGYDEVNRLRLLRWITELVIPSRAVLHTAHDFETFKKQLPEFPVLVTASHEFVRHNFGHEVMTWTLANLRNSMPFAAEALADRGIPLAWLNEIPVEEVHWVLRTLFATYGFHMLSGRGHITADQALAKTLKEVILRMDYLKRRCPELTKSLGANVAYERMHRRLVLNHAIRAKKYEAARREADTSSETEEAPAAGAPDMAPVVIDDEVEAAADDDADDDAAARLRRGLDGGDDGELQNDGITVAPKHRRLDEGPDDVSDCEEGDGGRDDLGSEDGGDAGPALPGAGGDDGGGAGAMETDDNDRAPAPAPAPRASTPLTRYSFLGRGGRSATETAPSPQEIDLGASGPQGLGVHFREEAPLGVRMRWVEVETITMTFSKTVLKMTGGYFQFKLSLKDVAAWQTVETKSTFELKLQTVAPLTLALRKDGAPTGRFVNYKDRDMKGYDEKNPAGATARKTSLITIKTKSPGLRTAWATMQRHATTLAGRRGLDPNHPLDCSDEGLADTRARLYAETSSRSTRPRALAATPGERDDNEAADRAIYGRVYAFRGGAEQVYRCAACGRRVFRTKKRYGLFLCWDEEPQPGEDATLLLAGRLRHRHCESVDVAVAAYPFNVDAEAPAPAPAPVAGARTRGRAAEQAVIDAAADARAAAATLDLPPEHVRLLLKSILDTDAVDRTLRAHIADVGSTHPGFDYHASALKRYWRSRVTLGMARDMKLGIARLDGQIGSDEQLISHTEDLIRRARAKLGPI